MSDLRIRQYSYFAITSKTLSSQDIEDTLLLKADKHEQWGKGRLRMDPTYQLTNVWKIVASGHTRVDDQIETLVKRLEPTAERLTHLVQEEDVAVTLQVVRHFDDLHGEEEIIDEDNDFVKLPGQHQLLGWGISAATLAFLVSLKADVDVDEYN